MSTCRRYVRATSTHHLRSSLNRNMGGGATANGFARTSGVVLMRATGGGNGCLAMDIMEGLQKG